MRIEEGIIIHRPPEEVFTFLEVRSNDAAWMESVAESEWLDSTAVDPADPIGVGRRGRMVMRLPGSRAEFIDEVTEYEPGRRIAHRTLNGPIQLNTASICQPAGDGCRANTSNVGAVKHSANASSNRRSDVGRVSPGSIDGSLSATTVVLRTVDASVISPQDHPSPATLRVACRTRHRPATKHLPRTRGTRGR